MAPTSRKRVVLTAASAFVLLALAAPTPALSRRSSQPTITGLQRQKLQEEIRQLRLANGDHRGARGFVSAYGSVAGFATGLAAVIGVLITYSGRKKDETRQRQLDRDQRQNEQDQRDLESQRRLDERFTAILTDLGSQSEAVQAGAAVSLLSFLRADREDFHRQVRLVTLANLKVDHSESISKLLIRVFETAARTGEPLDPFERDFSHAELRRVDLSGLDLREADVAYAQLRGANLSGANLMRARGYKVDLENARLEGTLTDLREVRFGGEANCANANFCEANLRAAHLKGAILTNARFQRGRLQSAHLEDADLRGARFEQCDLNDTYFLHATFDDVALKSILRAQNWEKAHFDADTRERLQALA